MTLAISSLTARDPIRSSVDRAEVGAVEEGIGPDARGSSRLCTRLVHTHASWFVLCFTSEPYASTAGVQTTQMVPSVGTVGPGHMISSSNFRLAVPRTFRRALVRSGHLVD